MADRIAGVGVLDKLGFRGGTGSEIQLKWIARSRFNLGFERARFRVASVVAVPARSRSFHDDSRERSTHAFKFCGGFCRGDDVTYAPAGYPISRVGGCQETARGNDHSAELNGGEHRFPQGLYVAEHQKNVVAPADAEVAQKVGNLRGTLGKLMKR